MLNKAKGWQGESLSLQFSKKAEKRETFRQIGQDDPLGSVAIPITMTPSELKNLRFQLDRVASLGPFKIEGPILSEKHKIGS